MPYDKTARLWPAVDEHFFREKTFTPQKQEGPHCVATALAIATDSSPHDFYTTVNTQDPVSWSERLEVHGLKLAYCPTDIRKLKFYLPELLSLNDLFALCYYTSPEPEKLLRDPNERGWLTGSHIVLLHRDQIIDPAKGSSTTAIDHKCNELHTKRIFRFVPSNHPRGL